MIDYKLFQFAAPPLTGVEWYISACQLSGLGPEFIDKAFNPWDKGQKSKILRISLVRNPFDWLVVAYENLKNIRSYNGFLEPFYSSDYNNYHDFVRSYLTNCPGSISELFNSYKADIVHRYEDLPWAYVELMNSTFEIPHSFLNRVLLTKPRIKVYSQTEHVLPRWLKLEIRKSEKEIFDAFEYY